MIKQRLAYLLTAAVIGAGCGNLPTDNAPAAMNNYTGKSQEIAAANGNSINEQYIVVFKDDVAQSYVETLANEKVKKHGGKLDKLFKNALKGFSAKMSREQADKLALDPKVKYVEQDRIISLVKPSKRTTTQPVTTTPTSTQVTPAGITRVGGAGDGTGKTAWIIDSGIDLYHPDLNVDVARSRTFVYGTTSAQDGNGHGTHVAGTVGAKNNLTGVVGVAANATLVAVRVLDNAGSGSYSGVIAGIDYVTANGRAGDVANMSLGGPASDAVDNAVRSLAAKGVKVVLAAGNSSVDASTQSPARVNAANVYTVSAVDANDYFAYFSNYGSSVDFAAPGVNILSTWIGGGTNTSSGTSMATPHVAGILLLGGVNASGYAINDPDRIADPIARR